MSKYQNGKIYKIVDLTNENTYYGSTIKALRVRLASHTYSYRQFLEGKTKNKLSSYIVLENNNYKIELVENYPCNSLVELHSREKHYIDNFPNINKNKVGLEYKINHKEYDKNYNKGYYAKNKDKYIDGKYNEDTLCECCNKTYKKLNFSRHLKSSKHKLNEESRNKSINEINSIKEDIKNLKNIFNNLPQLNNNDNITKGL
jgi:hypothetical protein